MLTVRDLVFKRQGRTILAGLNLDLQPGEIVALLGPSGCGKTTLLNLLAGFLKPTSGSIHCTLPCPGPALGYMRQDHGLLPWLNAHDNVCLGSRLSSAIAPPDEQELSDAFARFGLADCENARPAQLSGGQRQRLALLRTLLGKPQLLLLDEPLGHLDTALRLSLARQIKAYVEATHAAILLVTHQLEEAVQLADRVLILGGQPTSIRARYAFTRPAPPDHLLLARPTAAHALSAAMMEDIKEVA